MSIDRVVQPLVACLGHPVAGDPTQFVMSRIAREAQLDWRFFTSEVEPEQFETAFRGIQALGLAGAAILEPFQASVSPLVDSLSPTASMLGRVSVVRREEDAWIGDHTYGAAIMKLLQARFAGYAQREDGTMSPQSIAVWGSPETASVIDGLLSSLDGDFTVLLCQDQAGDPDTANRRDDKAQRSSSVQVVAIEEMASIERPVRALVFDPPAGTGAARPKSWAKRFSQIAWGTSPLLVCAQGRRQLDRETNAWLHGRNIQVADDQELMACRAAVDFHYWTGVEPNIELIREALEEYLQW